MANNFNVSLLIKGSKQSIDELETILRQEIAEGQTGDDYYTFYRSLKRMGYDPDKMDWRAYTEEVNRSGDELSVNYVGAWGPRPQNFIAIRERWPDLTLSWEGMDEFGQCPELTYPEYAGKYHLEDEDEGLNPFSQIDYWVSSEEALKAINAYYGTSCECIDEAVDAIPALYVAGPAELYEERQEDLEAVRNAASICTIPKD